MQEPASKKRRCSNCGNELKLANESPSTLEPLYICPVCHFQEVTTGAARPHKAITLAELATQLKNFLNRARADGVESEEIINILRAEIEFEAEMGHLGRRVMVQIIDLGFQESPSVSTAESNSRGTLHNHGNN